MAENKGKFIIKLALVLLAVSAVMALALGLMNEATKEPIRIGAEERPRRHMQTYSMQIHTKSFRFPTESEESQSCPLQRTQAATSSATLLKAPSPAHRV